MEAGEGNKQMYPAETDSSGDYIIEDLSGVVSITEEGIASILETDDGRNQPTDRHRRLLKHAFEWLSRIEFSKQIVPQESHRGVPDAQADLPIEGEWQSLSEAHEKWEELAE